MREKLVDGVLIVLGLAALLGLFNLFLATRDLHPRMEVIEEEHSRLDSVMHINFARIDAQFDNVDMRFDSLLDYANGRFNQIEIRLTRIETLLDERLPRNVE